MVSQGAVGPESVVLSPPSFYDHLGFPKRVENLPVEHLVSKLTIEGLIIPILPGAAWLDEQGPDADAPQPPPDCFGSKFGSIVRTEMLRRSIFDKKIRETLKYIIGGNFPSHYNGQRLPSIFVDDRQHLQCPSLMCPGRHKIIGPDMVSMRGPQPHTGTISEPQTAPLWLPRGHFQPLLTPDALHPFVVHLPPIPSQQGRYPSIAIPSIPRSQGDDRDPERLLIIPDSYHSSLGRSRVPYRPTRTPL